MTPSVRTSSISLLATQKQETSSRRRVGVRKLRWRRQGTGKRGGVRVIYFYQNAQMPIFLLLIYAKARREDMTPDEKRQVTRLAAALRQAHRQRG
jgi:hypothetical protein